MKRILPIALVAAVFTTFAAVAQEAVPPVPDTPSVRQPVVDPPPPERAEDPPATPPEPPRDQPPPVPDSLRLNRDNLRETYFRVGFYGGYAWNFHQTSATLFTGGGECGAFNNGRGNGPAIGVFAEIPVLPQWLDAVVAVNFFQRGGTFGEVYTAGLPVLDPSSKQYVPLERVHRYSADLGYLFGELGARFTPIDDIPFYARLGGGVGITPSTPTHTQTEEILSPEGVLYPETNTRVRNVSSGSIRDVGPHIAVGAALGYELRIGPRMTAAPEVSYYYALNDVTPNYRWRISAAQAGLAVRWSFGKLPELPKPPPDTVIPPPPPEPQPPRGVIASAGAGKIEIVETVVTETFPILPYIFFDSASAEIAPRYRRIGETETVGFVETALPHRSLAAYYEMLNIVGSRLARTPAMKITLNGTTDGREQGTLPGARELARGRAEAVKNYLVNTWKVDPARIAITTSALPSFPSSMEYAEGAEENRRVEILAADGEVLRPIIFERFNEHAIEPKQIPLSMSASSESGIASWQLNIAAAGESVWRQGGNGEPPPNIAWQLDADAAAALAKRLSGDGVVRCELRVTDNNGKTSTSYFDQPARKMLNPFEVSRLSLIVFDFDKSAINQQNQQMISSFVSKSMQPTSTAAIVGSTDRLGELEHNKELSISRAEAVRDLVVKEQPKANITSVEGVGPSRLLYDNATPEGRYYCRTVQVEVKTPIGDALR